MTENKPVIFCERGGCTAKLGAGLLSRILDRIPRGENDPDLLVGFDSHDDGAVYRLTDDLAVIQTLDFFPPMVEDPFLFGQIAAANAMSDVYAMGGEVRTALNIVCYPESMDLNILGEILRGGAEKVIEAGGSLAGGHSIADSGIRYGLSVTGVVHPDRIYRNQGGRAGDVLVLTKPLGTGILTAANRVGEADPEDFRRATDSMRTLNRRAAQISRDYPVRSCTDVTGFGLLGHLHEMLEDSGCSGLLYGARIPVFPGALEAAEEFLITGGGQKNRNYAEPYVRFNGISFALEEVLFDPQTSGGLLFALDYSAAAEMCARMREEGIRAQIIGDLIPQRDNQILVEG